MKYIGFLIIIFIMGCNERDKTLVISHNTIGALLISTKDTANSLHNKGLIKEETYQSIRVNWLKAQKSYIEASVILESMIGGNSQDLESYLNLITQINTILADIILWMEEKG